MRSLASGRRESSEDVGTLWTMQRSGHQARCALIALVGEWEPRLIVDGSIVLAERCPRGAEAFALADAWKRRMLDKGWRQVVPAATLEPVGRAQTGANERQRVSHANGARRRSGARESV